jgi:hypothetical protein
MHHPYLIARSFLTQRDVSQPGVHRVRTWMDDVGVVYTREVPNVFSYHSVKWKNGFENGISDQIQRTRYHDRFGSRLNVLVAIVYRMVYIHYWNGVQE